MKSKKLLFGLILIAIVLGGLGAGATYLTLSLRERKIQDNFDLARTWLDERDYEQADKAIDALVERGRGKESWYPAALALQLEFHRVQQREAEQRGDAAAAEHAREARAVARTILEPARGYAGPAVIDARGYLGWSALEEDNDAKTATEHFEKAIEMAGRESPGADLARLGLARIQMASAGVSPEVRDELLALLKTFPDSRYRPEIEHVLGICNIEMLFSRRQFPGDAIYPVGDGDTIYRIAKEHDIPQDLLLRVNGMSEADARRLGLGRRIKIPKVDFSIRVDKSDNTLTLMNFGRFFKRYLVRTGVEEWQTPAGQYKVQSKKRDPEWTDPQTGRRHAPNAAGNELGTRWIGFLDPSLGIHGTIHPDTVGGYASNGCVGMFRQDVEEIFDLVQLGTPVEIVGATRPAPIVRRE